MPKTKVKADPTTFMVRAEDGSEETAEVRRAIHDPGVIRIEWMCGNRYEITETALKEVIKLLREMPVGTWISVPLLDEDAVYTVKRYGRATTRVKLFTNESGADYFTFNLTKAVAAIEAALEPKE